MDITTKGTSLQAFQKSYIAFNHFYTICHQLPYLFHNKHDVASLNDTRKWNEPLTTYSS